MTENVDSLVLEQLRAIRTDIAKLGEPVRGLTVEVVPMRRHQRGIELTQDVHHDDIASIKARLERIERRLELAE